MNARPRSSGRCLLASLFCVFAAVGSGLAQGAVEGQSAAPPSPAESAPTPLPSVSLQDCLAASQAGAPALKSAQLTLDSAAAQLALSVGANGLTLGETAGYFHEENLPGVVTSSPSTTGSSRSGVLGENVQAGLSLSGPSTSFGVSAQQGIAAAGGQSTSLSISGSQVVFDGYPGGRSAGLVGQAEYAYQVAQIGYDAALKALAYQVKQAYYTLLGAQNILVAREATVRQAEANLVQMQAYFAAKRATSLDVLQVQVALTQARLDLRSAQNDIDTYRRRLSLAVGWPLDRSYAVAAVPSPEPPAVAAQSALDTALANRSELKTLDLSVASAGIDLALQKSQYSPSVSVNGSLGFAKDWPDSAGGSGSFTAGVTVALPPLYDGKQQSSSVRQKTDQLESYKLQRAEERQSIAIDVQSALFAVKDSNDRLDLAKQNLEQAQGQYDLEQAKLRAGLGTTLDVLTAFSALAAAQVGLEQARATYAIAVLNLDNVMGQ